MTPSVGEIKIKNVVGAENASNDSFNIKYLLPDRDDQFAEVVKLQYIQCTRQTCQQELENLLRRDTTFRISNTQYIENPVSEIFSWSDVRKD